MILAVCVDDRSGLTFHNRRLSSDRAVIEDLVNLSQPNTIWIGNSSAGLFKGYDQWISVSDNVLDHRDGFCFAEYGDFLKCRHYVDALILYRWNRLYPSDVKFPLEAFLSEMHLKNVTEFKGSSHACITREVYVR